MSPSLHQDLQVKLEKAMRDVLNLDASIDVKTVTSKNNPSWDSLRHVALCLRLQSEFGVRFDGAELVNMRTYDDIVKTLSSHLKV